MNQRFPSEKNIPNPKHLLGKARPAKQRWEPLLAGSLHGSWGYVGRQKSLDDALANGPDKPGHPFPWGQFPSQGPLGFTMGLLYPSTAFFGATHYSQVKYWCWEMQQDQLHPEALSLRAVNAENGVNYGGRRAGMSTRNPPEPKIHMYKRQTLLSII